MIGRSALVAVGMLVSLESAQAQGPRISELAVLQPMAQPAAPAPLVTLSTAQRRAMSTGARTAMWAGIGAVAGFLIANVTTDEDGIKSAELTGTLAGAVTGAVFSLIVIPALWPSRS